MSLLPLLLGAALLLSACGGGGSTGGPGPGDTATAANGGGGARPAGPEGVWAKEVEAVMRRFENSSAHSVEAIHTSTSQFRLEPTYATYSDELAKLAERLEATVPPAGCEHLRDEMGELARKLSDVTGVLGDQRELSPEEFSALAYQQTYKFSRVGRRLTNLTIHPHC
ncbi:MAG TPA: hypothetical protein VMF55_01210 [Solirubrobacterales bacterium]|nr:hypothetical protein [Solirubrobacterales bacterium]